MVLFAATENLNRISWQLMGERRKRVINNCTAGRRFRSLSRFFIPRNTVSTYFYKYKYTYTIIFL
jgi:hypothetical protein